MKRILMFCASLLIAVHCFSQTGEIKPITAKALQTPNNVTFYFNVGDTTFWASMGQYGQMNLISKTQLYKNFVPYKGAIKNVDLAKFTIKASSIILKKDSVPALTEEGQMYWDSITQSVVVQSNNSDVHLNIGEELWVPMCYNNSGVNILNGEPVYISGSVGGYPTISIASNKTYTQSRLIGVATDDILNGGYGRVTRFGYVNGINLSSCAAGDNVYLGDGVLTHIRPTGGDFPVVIGKAIACSINGKLLVYPQNVEYTAETNQAFGWPSYLQGEQTTLSFTNATRTLNITPVLSTFYFYQSGIKYIKSGVQSFQITDVEGIHLLYYNQGVIYDEINPSRDQALNIIRNNVTISAIYWDATNKISIYTSNERHTFYWPSWVHAYAHLSFGTQYVYGLGLTNITLGSGSSNTDAQFGVDAGAISDEDITSAIDVVASTAGLPIYYRTGASGLWRRTARSGYSFLNDGTTGLAMYNLYSGGSWSVVSMTNNYYRLVHVFATNDIGLNKTIVMSGVAQYASAAAAEAAVSTEIANIYNSNLPFAEVKHIGSLILHTKTGLGNSVNARFVATTTGGSWLDFRKSNVVPTSSSGGSGATTFLSLSDTPSSYAGGANKLLGVDNGETGVEFKDIVKNATGLSIPTGQTYQINNSPLVTQQVRNGVTTTTPSEDAVHDAINTLRNNSRMGTANISATQTTVTFPTAFSNINYYLKLDAWYDKIIDGKTIKISNAIYDFSKSTTGFSFSVDTIAGSYQYLAVDSVSLSTTMPNNTVLWDDIVTSIGSPGVDNKIPTEKAVRTAISAGLTTYPSAGIVRSTGSAWDTSLTDNSTNWNTAYTDRFKWDGGASGLTASTGRISLGATTLGSNLFTITNPSAVTFPRFNADNTVSSLSASDFKTAIGGGTTTNNHVLKFDTGTTEGTDLYTFNGSSSKTIDIKAGSNITLTKAAGSVTIASSGGLALIDMVKYQEGGWSVSGASTINGYGLLGSSSTSATTTSVLTGNEGPYIEYTTSATSGDDAYVSSNSSNFFATQMPTVSYKFYVPGLAYSDFFIGFNSSRTNGYGINCVGLKYDSGDSNFYFVANTDGTATTTSTGIAKNYSRVLTFIMDFTSNTNVNMYLYDDTMSLIASTVISANIPTSNLYSVANIETQSSTTKYMDLFSSKIILKK